MRAPQVDALISAAERLGAPVTVGEDDCVVVFLASDIQVQLSRFPDGDRPGWSLVFTMQPAELDADNIVAQLAACLSAAILRLLPSRDSGS